VQTAVREAAARNGIARVEDLADILVARPNVEAIGFVGSADRAATLAAMLRDTIVAVTAIDPVAGLKEIFLNLGIPSDLLRQVDVPGLQRALEQLHSA
jgi:hypothetical protein